MRRHPPEPFTEKADVIINAVHDEAPGTSKRFVVSSEGVRAVLDSVEDTLAISDHPRNCATSEAEDNLERPQFGPGGISDPRWWKDCGRWD